MVASKGRVAPGFTNPINLGISLPKPQRSTPEIDLRAISISSVPSGRKNAADSKAVDS
jgi:hypothetical protein